MKFRRRPSPLLLLLLPSIASAVAVRDASDSTLAKNGQARDANLDPESAAVIDLTNKSKYEIGTKDAPVDGKDGKPHAGPWVGTEKDPNKPKSKVEKATELESSKSDLTKKLKTADGSTIPDSNDGVMDDPHRQVPKEGTRGTEGGVSAKDKVRKAKGEIEESGKTPGSPKEAPAHFTEHETKTEKPKAKEVQIIDEEVGEGLGGLEVCLLLPHFLDLTTNVHRNQTISLPNQTTNHIPSQSLRTRTTLISRMIANRPRNPSPQKRAAMA